MQKRILITGGASGIGAGIAQQLAGDGHHLIICDLDATAAEQLAEKINSAGAGSASALYLNVTDNDAIDSLHEELSVVDVLVNNAGLQHVSPIEDFPTAKWQQLIEVMLIGVANLSKAVLPGMRERGYGRIINMGSVHSLVASPYKSAYVAAKHGLLGFSKVLALETADTDITVNTVCPAYVKTPLVDKQIDDQAKSHQISREQVIDEIMLKPMPKGAFIEYDELAGTIAFLMSHAARNITGQTIVIDGGWTAR